MREQARQAEEMDYDSPSGGNLTGVYTDTAIGQPKGRQTDEVTDSIARLERIRLDDVARGEVTR